MESEFVDFLNNILYKICGAFPELLPQIHDLYKQRSTSTFDNYIWSEKSLKRALDKLSKQMATFGTYYIFVDGLDECTNYKQLVEYMKELSIMFKMGNIKLRICAASRPELEIGNRLDEFLGFKHEEETQSDIEIFVTKALEQATRDSKWPYLDELQTLMKEKSTSDKYWNPKSDNENLVYLRNNIVDGSQGVFIWAQLVVKDITTSIEEGNPIWEMYDYLQALPNDLNRLYATIFEKIDAAGYLAEALSYFDLVFVAGGSLTVLDFSLMEDELTGSYMPMLDEDREARIRKTRGKIQSRCKTLIELFDRAGENNWYDKFPSLAFVEGNPGVKVTHLTVVQYIDSTFGDTEDRNKMLISRYTKLMKMSLRRHEIDASWWPPDIVNYLKTADGRMIAQYGRYSNPAGIGNLHEFFYFAKSFERYSREPATRFVHHLNNFLHIYRPTWAKVYLYHQHHSGRLIGLCPEDAPDICTVAVYEDLALFLEQKFKNEPRYRDHRRPLLHCATLKPDPSPKIVKLLLENGWHPNYLWEGKSAWEVLCQYFNLHYDSGVMELFLEHGAKPNQRVRLEEERYCFPLHRVFSISRDLSDEEIFRLLRILLDHGANPKLRDSEGRSALDIAEAYKPEMKTFILEYMKERKGRKSLVRRVLKWRTRPKKDSLLDKP